MAKPKLPTDWCDRPLEKWNASTFRQYLADRHTELYGISYVTRNIAMESKMIRNMIDEHGAEVTKEFIDKCFANHRPSTQYPGVNFVFFYSYMRERILPQVLSEHARRQRLAQVQPEMTTEQINEWL